MNIGFTGSRNGMSNEQKLQVKNYLLSLQHLNLTVHHGDCKGSDRDFHNICTDLQSIKIIIHPPNCSTMRAFCNSDTILQERPFLLRNRDIVDSSEVLIACPINNNEIMRSGTWSTIRYARKCNKQVNIYV